MMNIQQTSKKKCIQIDTDIYKGKSNKLYKDEILFELDTKICTNWDTSIPEINHKYNIYIYEGTNRDRQWYMDKQIKDI